MSNHVCERRHIGRQEEQMIHGRRGKKGRESKFEQDQAGKAADIIILTARKCMASINRRPLPERGELAPDKSMKIFHSDWRRSGGALSRMCVGDQLCLDALQPDLKL